MNAKEKKLFHAVKLQRDALRKSLKDLCEQISNGVHNHMLAESNPRRTGTESKKCDKGKTRNDAIWSVGFFCTGCDGCAKQCQISYEEKNLFDSYHRAQKTCGKPDAEIPPIAPGDFSSFDPNRKYLASARWIAREFYRFAVGYWCYANHSNKANEKAWERALDDILAIALSTYWNCGKDYVEFKNLFQKLDKEPKEHRDKHEKIVQEFFESHPNLTSFLSDLDGAFQREVNSEKDIKTVILHMFQLSIEYRFGHDYPGGDIDFYDGAFCGITDDCLKVAGLYRDDLPVSYKFEDKAEYARKALEFELDQKEHCYAFLAEREHLDSRK